MTLAHLSIGTATSRIDLLDDHGYYAQDWLPRAGLTEDTFATSALADYRQLTSYRELTTVESIPLTLKQASQDQAVRLTQDLRRMLRAARDYWTTRHQPDPVYLKAQASCETNARYAIIHAGDVPEDSNPYGEPFLQAGNRAVMLQVLVLERGPWLEAAPGTATCALAAGYQPDFYYPNSVQITSSSGRVNCGSDASLDDLHTNAMTAEGWFNIYATGTAANDRIITKAGDVLDVGWVFYFSAANEVTFRVNYNAGDSSAVYTWTPDYAWHHWACTYNSGGDAKARIWLDGALVATAAAATAGAVDTDAANDLIIFNRASYDAASTGRIGWVRVSSSERYTIAFTPPAQCKLPDVDASTELLVIHEGQGATTYDLSGNGNNGTISPATWAISANCATDIGHTTPTCTADSLFIANKSTNGQLTHIYYYDDAPGTWSGNLEGATLPYDLLPAAPAVDDIVYFGIAEAEGTGPFSSLVLDLVAGTAITTAVWEYWNGAAWATLTTQDNTNILTASGVKSVHWSQPADWVAVDLVTAVGAGAPVITAWWVRMRVTAAGAATAPEAQNRQPYTVNWPWLEIEATAVPGDFEALLKAVLRCKSDDDAVTAPELYFNQVIVGLRSGDRIEYVFPTTNPQNGNFWPYINATDNARQNPTALTCTAVGTGAFAARSDSPTGEIIRCTNPGAAWATVWRIQTALYSPHQIYFGVYHAFLRAEMTSGATADIKVRYVTSLYPSGGNPSTTYTSKAVNVPARVTAGVYTAIDLGRMELPPSSAVLDTEYGLCAIEIQLYGNGAADLDICDLVIMPIDEWAVRVTGSSTTARVSAIEYNEYLTVDSITNPKVPIRAIHSTTAGTNYIQGVWSPAANGPAILHPNVKQRLYFFFPETEQSGGVLESRFEVCATAQLYRQARYLSMRGDR